LDEAGNRQAALDLLALLQHQTASASPNTHSSSDAPMAPPPPVIKFVSKKGRSGPLGAVNFEGTAAEAAPSIPPLEFIGSAATRLLSDLEVGAIGLRAARLRQQQQQQGQTNARSWRSSIQPDEIESDWQMDSTDQFSAVMDEEVLDEETWSKRSPEEVTSAAEPTSFPTAQAAASTESSSPLILPSDTQSLIPPSAAVNKKRTAALSFSQEEEDARDAAILATANAAIMPSITSRAQGFSMDQMSTEETEVTQSEPIVFRSRKSKPTKP
jgi:hypothetical protein